jgi:hypothetical protein
VAFKVADLYGLPLDEFTRARDELVNELRRVGKKEEAEEVKALRKPPVSAWTVNQVARRHPQETKALVEAGGELRKAQRQAVGGRGPEALREATRRHRARLDELTAIARRELATGDTTLQRVVQTIRSASVDKESSKRLLAGTLTADVEQTGFGSLLAAVPPGAVRRRSRPKAKPPAGRKAKPKPPKREPPPKPKRDPNAAKRARVQAQLERAQARVRELEERLRELGG